MTKLRRVLMVRDNAAHEEWVNNPEGWFPAEYIDDNISNKAVIHKAMDDTEVVDGGKRFEYAIATVPDNNPAIQPAREPQQFLAEYINNKLTLEGSPFNELYREERNRFRAENQLQIYPDQVVEPPWRNQWDTRF